jgi:hypothetical protein
MTLFRETEKPACGAVSFARQPASARAARTTGSREERDVAERERVIESLRIDRTSPPGQFRFLVRAKV